MISPDVLNELLRRYITIDVIEEWKGMKDAGNTQAVERIYIKFIKDIFDSNSITYEKAPSQRPYDFREIGGIGGIKLEVKMTTSNIIMCNNTLPTSSTYYLIIYLGTTKYPPQLIFVRGDRLVVGSEEWIFKYKELIESLINTYALKESREIYGGSVTVRPRPSYSILLKETGLLIEY